MQYNTPVIFTLSIKEEAIIYEWYTVHDSCMKDFIQLILNVFAYVKRKQEFLQELGCAISRQRRTGVRRLLIFLQSSWLSVPPSADQEDSSIGDAPQDNPLVGSVSKEQDIKGGPLSAEGIIHSGVFLGSVFLPNH